MAGYLIKLFVSKREKFLLFGRNYVAPKRFVCKATKYFTVSYTIRYCFFMCSKFFSC